MEKLTLILGVHRSGTSLLSIGLQAAGVSAGSFEDIREPDNPLGYGEHHDVRNFNDRLLEHLGASWDNWGFRASDVDFRHPAHQPWVSEGIALLRSAFPGKGPFLLKDPRCLSLAPFWERIVPEAGFELRRILIVRDPWEVAESQSLRAKRRPHLFPVIADAESMAALWTVCMVEVLTSLTDDHTLLLRHADLLSDPEKTLACAASFAGAEVCNEAIAAFAAENVLPSLYRSRARRGRAGPWLWSATSIFDAMVASGTPRRLTAADARALMDNRLHLRQMMRGLPAARKSIARMRVVHAEQQARISALSAVILELAQALRRPPDADIEEVLDRALRLSRSPDLNGSD